MPDNCCGCGNNNAGNTFFSYPMSASNPCSPDCGTAIDTACVHYTGPDLTCIDIQSNIDLQSILIAMDSAICAGGGGFDPLWDMQCLVNEQDLPIENFQQFVESISLFVCDLEELVNTFIVVTYAADFASLLAQIAAFNNPNTTPSVFAGITGAENLFQTLNLLSGAVQTLADDSNVTLADWNQCFIVTPLPTTVVEAFDMVIDMICMVKAAVPDDVSLPTFDNTGTCLPAPTAADSLVVTVTNIRDILCTKPDFDAGSLVVGCLDIDNTDLQTTVQTALDELELVAAEAIRAVDGTYFALEYINPLNPCEGQTITFTGALAADRYVAMDDSDVLPGTLADKLTAGDNIVLDFGIDNPGFVTIHGTDQNVAADPADTTPGPLIDKIDIQGDLAGIITFNKSYNAGTGMVEIVPTIDVDVLAAAILSIYGGSQNAGFCALTCDCPCTAPPDPLDRTVSAEISAVGGNKRARLAVTQLSPTLAWFDVDVTVPSATTFSTGSYAVTSSDVLLMSSLSLTNTDSALWNFTITIEDGLGFTVPGSTTVSSSLAAGASYVNGAFALGDSPTSQYVIKLNVNT